MAESFIILRRRITLHPHCLGGRYPDFPDTHSEKVPVLCWRLGEGLATPTITTVHVNGLGLRRQ